MGLTNVLLCLPLSMSAAASLFLSVGGDDVQAPTPTATSIGLLPRGLTSFGAAADGGWLYVMGGYHGTPHAYSVEGQSAAFMQVNLLEPGDLRLLPDVEPVQGVELEAWRGKLVRVGGMHARNAEGEDADLHSTDRVALFDPLEGSWTELPALPEGRSSHRAVVIGDRLHVVGGWTMTGAGAKPAWRSELLTLDLTAPDLGWASAPVPFQRRALGAAATAAGELVVVGGLTPDRKISAETWILSADGDSWTQGPDFPDRGFGVAASPSPRGVVASGKSGEVYVLGADGGSWEPLGRLSHGRIFHELVPGVDGDLVAMGGIVGMGTRGRVRSIERLSLAPAAPALAAPSVERSSVPAPCAFRNRFGMFTHGRSLFLFGGNRSLGQHDFGPENFCDDAWRLDLGALTWAKLDPMPVRRQTMAAALVADGSTGIAVGGFGHDGEEAVTQGTSLLYDLEFGEWSEGPRLRGTRSQFGLARRGDELFVFGGLDYDPGRGDEAFDHRLDVLRWDGASDAFEDSGIVLPRPRRAFAGARLGDRYYLVGGMREGFRTVDACDVYDFGSGTWSTIPAPSRPRLGADLVALEGALYLVGGTSPKPGATRGFTSNPTIERFDPHTGEWTVVLEDIGADMKHARALAVDGRLLVVTLHRAGTPRVELIHVNL